MLSLVEHGSALGQTAQLERRLTELTALLVHEHRLIEDLRQALLHQRAGVATNDAALIDASVGAVGRTLLTIDAARRCRTGSSPRSRGTPRPRWRIWSVACGGLFLRRWPKPASRYAGRPTGPPAKWLL